MKQTAVDWLYEHILLTPLDIRSINKCLEQAKEMEKEQICDAYYYGIDVDSWNVDNPYEAAEQYYNETYESNTCLLRDGCDGLMCYNCIKKQKQDESKTNI
jgi:hypothetical protein